MNRAFAFAIFFGLLAGCGPAQSSDASSGDEQVIAALKDAGSDLSKPHPIDFYLVEFPDEASAKRAGAAVTGTGWTIDVHQQPFAATWTVIASTVMVPELTAISAQSERFALVASENGGDYDGWEAAVTK